MRKTIKRWGRTYLDNYFREKFEQLIDNTNELNQKLDELKQIVDQNRDLLLAEHSRTPELKKQLQQLRNSSKYDQYFKKTNPLISVRIATYNRAKLLTDRAIPSVLQQTYQNFEIIVVGDHCTDDTKARIKKLNDKRIRFYNLPQHSYYPEDKYKKWLVVGAAAANRATELAKGDWIATLDDDDTFRPNHLKALIKLAQNTKSELVYSALLSTHQKTKEKIVRWSDPPQQNHFSMMSAIYLRAVAEFIKTDEQGWAVRAPQDMYLCQRMLMAGVKYASTKTVTGDINHLLYTEKHDL